MTPEEVLLKTLENLRQENQRLKQILENRRVWVKIEKSSIYDDYLMKVVGVSDDYSKADAWRINRETEMNTKKDLEVPKLERGDDAELDNFNRVKHTKEEAEKWLGCELLRFHIE